MQKRVISVQLCIAAVGGASLGAALLAVIGGTGRNAVTGGAVGAILGAVVGVSAYCGRIRCLTTGAIFYGLIGCVLGPAVDDYGGQAAIPFACIGAFIAWIGWRYLLTLPAACVGAIFFAREPELWIKIPIGLVSAGGLVRTLARYLSVDSVRLAGALSARVSAHEIAGNR
jgi:hypothetical protein